LTERAHKHPLWLKQLTREELADWLAQQQEPPYRARQLFHWLYRRLAADFAAMTDLPAATRQRLAQGMAQVDALRPAACQESADGSIKLAFSLYDRRVIESVLIPHRERTTVCVSSQVGCGYGCRLCATGQLGFSRNLYAAEIVDQVVQAQRQGGRRISNVVFMGMGEPLANYDQVLRAVRLLNDREGLGIAARHIAISTCGLPPQMRRLAGEKLQLHLAVSLHAPSDELRSQLLPINRRYPLRQVLQAARHYAERTGRKVTFQYTLIGGVNDSPAQARRLAGLVRGMPCLVNLIPLNQALEGYRPPERPAVTRFRAELAAAGVEVAVRRSYGADIRGACGQLAAAL